MEKRTVWIRGNKELVQVLKVAAIKRNTDLMDLLTWCVVRCLGEEIPEHLRFFGENVLNEGLMSTDEDGDQ